MDYPSFLFVIFYILQLVNHAEGYMCETKVERVGCFNDKSRPLDGLLVYRRAQYNYKEQKTALPRLLCDCAVKAQLQGYHYIGLQYYAECWTSGESQPHYDRDGPSTDNCFNAEFQPCSQNDSECVGGARANFIYKIVNQVEPMSEMNGTISSSLSAQEVLQQTTTEMKLLQNKVPTEATSVQSAPTTKVTEPSKQPPSTPPETTYMTEPTYTPSTREYVSPKSTFQVPNKPSEQTEQPIQITISSTQAEMTTPVPPPSQPTLPMTEKSTSIHNEIPPNEMTETIPSTVASAASTMTPCYDKLTTCGDFTSYCSSKYPYMLEQCPKTCQLCN